MIQEATQLILQAKDLNQDQMTSAMEEIMKGQATTPEIVSFLTALSQKGETIEELSAAVSVMRSHAIKIKSEHEVILDTCGTGGDAKGTFNISTIVAFVVAGADVAVAKHGNRSISSRCGSADILEALGVNINLAPEKIQACLNKIGIAFLFAQNLHPAMKHAAAARKEIGKRTIFNMLGPLSNPAGATHQLIGVCDIKWKGLLAEVLGKLGVVHAMVVCGEDGLDEITITGKTFVSEIYKGRLMHYEVTPEEFWIERARLENLKGGSVSENGQILVDVLNGKTGPQRDIVILNAAVAFYVADKVWGIRDGVALARKVIDSKRAWEKFELLKKYSNAA